jgi:MoaA/NifB/PqqE/SkfB family radical SAM enzyme
MEWNNTYNSFNSAKGLSYYDNYKKIMEWMDGKGELPPPIEVNLDPFAECNNACYFCIGQRYLKSHREEVGEMRVLPFEYMMKLVEFLYKWGVRGLCISGGGEPSLHPQIDQVLSYADVLGMDTSFVTNAVNIPDKLGRVLNTCRWVALSVNAGKRETYKQIIGKDHFDQVIENIRFLTERRKWFRSKTDFAYKMLILPENQYEIFDACKLAKEIGVQDFHVRPVDFERGDIEGHKQLELDLDSIKKQFEQCHDIEDDTFHVYTVTHKFDTEFHNIQPFKRCLATPLLLPILTDGNGYICVDVKMIDRYRIGSAYPDPETILDWWGSDKHRDMVKSITPCIDCADRRCTFGQYNKQIEEVILDDRMCLSFP